ncbi:uncharacterized protein CLUP02_05841 [Colletotrichum lupini]|uniref:NAD(P)-binding protein n=1 Tax=Colletotrichum lupini TaxID=145971 RepID=A0A9Q8SNI4_9PEZI|nr:uncharacterized protein CLUP02_05841 [Colletotrichum lupini]UQC80358.1 hypothetical protein CLUP02_05841 [Colletotrichum lupini]
MPSKAALDELTSATEIFVAFSESVTGKIIHQYTLPLLISFKSIIPVVDILINNAGVIALPDFQLSEDSIEMTFATNHVGHFLFTNLILSKIIKAGETSSKPTRIINGYQHLRTPILAGSFLRHQLQQDSRGASRRRTSNLQKASFLTGQEWSEKSYTLEAKYGIRSYAIHPGAVTTNINRHAKSEEIKKALKRLKRLGFETPAKTLDQGADSSVISAVDPELPSMDLSSLESKGLYMIDCELDDEQCAGFARNLEYADKI